MASLANQTISSTYDGLIKTSTDQPVGVSGVQLLEDGVGNTLALSVGRANQGVTVTGTLTATTLTGTISATSVLADGVTATTQSAGDNSTKVATTAYVDSQVSASDLDFAGDAGTGAVDLDSQTFTIAGTANEIETSASGQTITIGLPSSVTVGTLNATTLAGTLSTAAQTNITSVGTLSSLAVSGGISAGTFVKSSGAIPALSASNIFIDQPTSVLSRIGIVGANASTKGTLAISQYSSDGSIGADVMRIDASGNVGIGTSSPLQKLEVIGTGMKMSDGVYTGYFGKASTFTGSTTNAFAVRSDNDLTFGTGGPYERLRITSTGNVGIGTTSPATKLEVVSATSQVMTLRGESAGGSNNTQLRFYGSQSAADLWAIGTDVATGNGGTYFSFYDLVANAERLRIDASGNLLVGLTSGGKFSVSYGGNDTHFGLGANYDNYITAGSSGTTIFRNGTTEKVRIDSSGNVGIGTAVAAGANGKGLAIYASDFPRLSFRNSTTTDGTSRGYTMYGVSNSFYHDLVEAGDLIYRVNGSERMRITSGGFLKASNAGSYSSATGDFHEINSSTTGTVTLRVEDTSASPYGYAVAFSTTANNGTNYFANFLDTSAQRCIIYSNGGIANYQSNDSNLSDERVKTDINPLGSYWDKFKALELVTFKYKDQTHDDDNIGLIAQQVESVAPEFVSNDGFGETPEGEEPLKTIYTADLYHATIKVLQEAMAKIETLEAEVESLKSQLNA